MSEVDEPQPLIVDTGAFFAYYYARATEHDTARRVFEEIREGELLYRPLYISQAVLGELATLLTRKSTHEVAVRALGEIRQAASFNVLPVDRGTFDAAATQFAAYDDQTISFVDHTTSVLADERGIEHVFGFDSDFRTLGFTRVPTDLG